MTQTCESDQMIKPAPNTPNLTAAVIILRVSHPFVKYSNNRIRIGGRCGRIHRFLDISLSSLFFHPCCPECSARSRSQKKEEGQNGNEFQYHCHCAKPYIFPTKARQFLLLLWLGQAAELEPSIMRQLSEPCASNHDECNRAYVRDEVER